ncbi:MAG: hypothetical protein CML99_07270 [Rhodobiaceae bacterium]|nr:hypothetical protein [Rhodobiaceae bacterium]
MLDDIEIGGDRGYYSRPLLSEEEILVAEISPPVFERGIDELEQEVRSQVGRVSIPRSLQKPHRFIRRLLDADEARAAKIANERFAFSWDQPKFEAPFEKRRLRVINGLYSALERLGAKPHAPNKYGRGLSVRVNNQLISLWVDDAARKVKADVWQHDPILNPSGHLKIALPDWRADGGARKVWEDTKDCKVENLAADIVAEVLLDAEIQYREACEDHITRLSERKTEVIERRRLEKEEAERSERARLEQLEQDRIDSLLADATALQQADTIRRYVKEVEKRAAGDANTVPHALIKQWAAWALAQADRIDPIISDKYLEFMTTERE